MNALLITDGYNSGGGGCGRIRWFVYHSEYCGVEDEGVGDGGYEDCYVGYSTVIDCGTACCVCCGRASSAGFECCCCWMEDGVMMMTMMMMVGGGGSTKYVCGGGWRCSGGCE